MTTLKTANTFRKYHRLLGFFLAGIMSIYACSGVLLIFRGTDFLQYDQMSETELPPGLNGLELESILRLRGFEVIEETSVQVIFPQGSYNKKTGLAVVTEKDYPLPVYKLISLHKATNESPLFFMNIFFGATLLFFSVSSFFMFVPKLPVYRTGLKFAAGGFVLALIMVLVA